MLVEETLFFSSFFKNSIELFCVTGVEVEGEKGETVLLMV